MKHPRLSKNWSLFIFLALVSGFLLRVLFVQDMEYKEDEEYNFTQSQLIGNSQPWPWYGIPSGVYLVNPGMSIWVFAALAKLFHLHTPTSLATGVQLFALVGMSLIIPFAIRWLDKKDRPIWLWAFALAMVNPFLVLYQRKLWPEPFLPFFTMLTIMGWWRRSTFWGAVIWGCIGAWLGQIHMSGFFFAFALFAWTLAFDRKRNKKDKKTHWLGWFTGSVVGALPLIPWFLYIVQNPIKQSMSTGWAEAIQLKYWVFWITDPTGLHLGNPLGLLRGPSNWDQISDFIRYPILGGVPTYSCGLAHLVAFVAVLAIFAKAIVELAQRRKHWGSILIAKESDTAFLQNSAFWLCGALLTITGVMIRRYYMNVTFPLEFIWLIRLANPATQFGRKSLALLWIAELIISSNFVGYIHVNEGSTQGDYGRAYHLIHPDAGTR